MLCSVMQETWIWSLPLVTMLLGIHVTEIKALACSHTALLCSHRSHMGREVSPTQDSQCWGCSGSVERRYRIKECAWNTVLIHAPLQGLSTLCGLFFVTFVSLIYLYFQNMGGFFKSTKALPVSMQNCVDAMWRTAFWSSQLRVFPATLKPENFAIQLFLTNQFKVHQRH